MTASQDQWPLIITLCQTFPAPASQAGGVSGDLGAERMARWRRWGKTTKRGTGRWSHRKFMNILICTNPTLGYSICTIHNRIITSISKYPMQNPQLSLCYKCLNPRSDSVFNAKTTRHWQPFCLLLQHQTFLAGDHARQKLPSAAWQSKGSRPLPCLPQPAAWVGPLSPMGDIYWPFNGLA